MKLKDLVNRALSGSGKKASERKSRLGDENGLGDGSPLQPKRLLSPLGGGGAGSSRLGARVELADLTGTSTVRGTARAADSCGLSGAAAAAAAVPLRRRRQPAAAMRPRRCMTPAVWQAALPLATPLHSFTYYMSSHRTAAARVEL